MKYGFFMMVFFGTISDGFFKKKIDGHICKI